MRYKDYLNTDHWKELREAKLLDVDFRCEKCRRKSQLEVHHRHYNTYGHERLSDLQVLCRNCHQGHHDAEFAHQTREARPKEAPKCRREEERDFRAWKHARVLSLETEWQLLAEAGKVKEAEKVHQRLRATKQTRFNTR